jgi:hypothetical protein
MRGRDWREGWCVVGRRVERAARNLVRVGWRCVLGVVLIVGAVRIEES